MALNDTEIRHAIYNGGRVRELADVMKQVLSLRHVWRFILPAVGMPCMLVFDDDEGAVQLTQKPITNSNSKQLDVRDHFLRELVGRKDISIIHVPSPF